MKRAKFIVEQSNRVEKCRLNYARINAMVIRQTVNTIRKLASRTIHIFPLLFSFSGEPDYPLKAPDACDRFTAGMDLRAAIFNSPEFHKQKYWSSKSAQEVIDLADDLYMRGKFLEVYELLNRLKYGDNTDVQWRIARSLFMLSKDETFEMETRKDMIAEAFEMLKIQNPEDSNANVYKWLAIVLDAKNEFEGLEKRVHAFPNIRQYLLKAIQLNPDDFTCFYILGKWCFDISRMSYLQRSLSKFLFGPVPETSFQEAYNYLERSYQIRQDNYYIPIMYMLGEACYQMNQFFRAEFYLKSAVILQPRSNFESECLYKAQKLLKRLELYDLSKETVLFEYPF